MTRSEEIEQAAKDFAAAHPEVWDLFVRFSLQAINRGFDHYSAKAIFERIRWETDMGGDGIATFKINNNFPAYYARWFMQRYPMHAGFFRTRSLASEAWPACDLPPLGPADYPSL